MYLWYKNASVNTICIDDDNIGILHVFERDLSKCEIELCDRKIYIDQFLDIYFLKILYFKSFFKKLR